MPRSRRAECNAPHLGTRKPLSSIPRTGSAPCSVSTFTGSRSLLTALQKRVLSRHLSRYIVDSGHSCSARRTEERAHGRSLSSATAACPGTELVVRNPRRHPTSHSSQTDGSPAWSHCPNILFAPDSSGRKLAAPPQQATGTHAHGHHPHSWGRGRTGPPPHRGSAQLRMAATAPAARHPRHMPSLRPGGRTA
ncbi:hypothetical protein TcCL_Unassigned00633, partial [Trypanosoma cruzi]